MAEIFKTITEPLQSSAAVKSVFGEPVTIQGKTVIPVARIAYGFGGGSGKRAHEVRPGEGEGGGGGVVATPLGVFEVTESETRFIPLHENRKFLASALAGLIIGFLWARRVKRKEKDRVKG
ncbi:MAG: spore germination protein GerW family protein [Bryobacteraceae bacterium]|jgi:uncharacterized spore protein YtfJ